MKGKILSNKELFYYEDEISVECDHGYFIAPSSPSRVLKCENSGQWSANMPNCTSMYEKCLCKFRNNTVEKGTKSYQF